MARVFVSNVDGGAELLRIRRPSDWDWARWCARGMGCDLRKRLRLAGTGCRDDDWLAGRLLAKARAGNLAQRLGSSASPTGPTLHRCDLTVDTALNAAPNTQHD